MRPNGSLGKLHPPMPVGHVVEMVVVPVHGGQRSCASRPNAIPGCHSLRRGCGAISGLTLGCGHSLPAMMLQAVNSAGGAGARTRTDGVARNDGSEPQRIPANANQSWLGREAEGASGSARRRSAQFGGCFEGRASVQTKGVPSS